MTTYCLCKIVGKIIAQNEDTIKNKLKKKNEERQLGISEVEREGNEIEIVKTL